MATTMSTTGRKVMNTRFSHAAPTGRKHKKSIQHIIKNEA